MIIDYLKKTYNKPAKEFYQIVDLALLKEEKMFIVTANPEVLMIGHNNKELNNILEDENVTIVPDGIGVVKAMRRLGIHCQERITGVDLVSHLLKSADDFKKSVYFYGGSPHVIDMLVKKVESTHPNLIISGSKNGYDYTSQEVFEEVKELEPDIILVALGVPKQELAIHENIYYFNKGIFVGVGGSFDVLSGAKSRAPKIFIKLNLEWLYRIIKEPSRFRRFFNSNIKFLFELRK